jgi:uncharacterized membrane protein
MRRADTSLNGHGRLVWGVVLFGIGIGGFFDGIVLHQILQWHHMVSEIVPVNTVAGLEANTLGDGFFHMATYLATIAGVALTWGAARRMRATWSWLVPIGGLFAGWGVFNLVEGIVDHHILQVDHVRPGPDELAWNLGSLHGAWGAFMLIGGGLVMRAGLHRLRDRERSAAEDMSRFR